ncbi:MAG TPA: hypothetical protein VJ697_06865 [Nitrososphaeraceae archaeon]|nr:hypothetical protein [Nitrososphaeraceae archaeon]
MNSNGIFLIIILIILSLPLVNNVAFSSKIPIPPPASPNQKPLDPSGVPILPPDESKVPILPPDESKVPILPDVNQQDTAPFARSNQTPFLMEPLQNGLLSLDSKIFEDLDTVRQAIKNNDNFEAYRALNSIEQQLLNLVGN